jgi:sulfatase maturation enzyme AslB (radical SAM superfamily)
MHPFTGLATREDGAIKVCCRSLPIANIKDMSLEEAWNSDKMKEVRRQVLNDERPDVCEPCFDLEDQGVQSLRQRHITDSSPESRINLYPNALDKLNDDYSMPFELPTIEIKINNLCNLKCRMCNPLDSTQWKDWNSIVDHYKKEENYLVDAVESLGLTKAPYVGIFEDKAHFWDNLEKLLPYFRRVEFAGGEPLMDPVHYKILDLLSKNGDNIEIKYATNGTKLGIKGGRTVHDYWPKFKSVAVNVSIDGLHDTYEYIRGNGKFSDVEYNIKEMKKIKTVSRIVGAFTVQANNIMQIDKVIDYFLREMKIVFYSHRVSYPRALSAQVLPKALKDQVVAKLEAMKPKIKDYEIVKQHPILEKITQQQIQDNINFLQAKDLNEYWLDCVDFNRKLDLSRNQGPFEKINPEFQGYV